MNQMTKLKYMAHLIIVLFFWQITITKNNQEKSLSMITFDETAVRTFSFNYDNEDLINVINELAAEKEINVILPQGVDAINAKLTLHVAEKLSIDQAWELLLTILDVAGFTVVPKNGLTMIVKNTTAISREPLPTYIGTNPDHLPDNDQRIRYLYYLANIQVSAEPDSEINAILKDLLPADALFKFDKTTNSLIVVAKANMVKNAIFIIKELDQPGFQEKMVTIHLHHASARIVADLFNNNILKSVNEANRYRLDTRKQTELPYFSTFTKIIPEERTNSLIILGRSQAVERIENFIKEYIDVELESGKSILHIYQLQYLDAENFGPVLTKIVESSRIGGSEQSSAVGKEIGGIERFFEEVIIKTDTPAEGEARGYYGGNKLVIAARNKDWQQIKKLIEELDTPQPQVFLEVLVADMTIEDTRLLGNMVRNPEKIPILNQMQFQSAQLTPGVVTDSATEPTTVATDLLRKAFNSEGESTNDDPTSTIATFAQAGSTVASFNDNDGKTWGILEILDLFTHLKVLSHPHIIATNNKKAEVSIGEERYLRDEVSGSLGGTTVRKFKPIQAELKIEITPRISADNTVNLQVLVNINDFIAGSDAQTIRKVETNANIISGSIFAIGGLVSLATNHSANQTPLIGKVPGLGWLFKRRAGKVIKNNLTVFISPTIIQPRLREGMGKFTQDYIGITKNVFKDSQLFSSLKDPISRWFFSSYTEVGGAIDEFTAKDDLQSIYQEVVTKDEENNKERPTKQYVQADVIDKKNKVDKIKLLLQKDDTNPFEKVIT
jgi:general secretion pathway protein D